MSYEFESHDRKALRNLEKHGVSFGEAEMVFEDPLAATFDDPEHSTGEQRYYIIGLSSGRRLLAVWYTERGGSIRILSARPVTKRERKGYENERQN